MEKLCESLDQIVLDIFQVLEDLYEKQAELDQALKNGFFSMARARYNMGMKRVTADQILDADLTAKRTVQVNSDACGDEPQALNAEDISQNETIEDLFLFSPDDDLMKDAVNKNKDSEVRKRGVGKAVEDSDKEWEEVQKMIQENDKKFKLTNPINLFGVLVPQALRSSQKSFEDAVTIGVGIANQKYKLKVLQKKFNHLKDEKSKLASKNDPVTENES